MEKKVLTDEIKQRWQQIIENEDAPAITDNQIKNTTIRLLENAYVETLKEANNTTSVGNIASPSDNDGGTNPAAFNPMLFAMTRRAAPVLIAHHLMGVQPMQGPSQVIFAINQKRTGAGYTGSSTPLDVWDPAGINQAGGQGYNPSARTTQATGLAEVLGKDEAVSDGTNFLEADGSGNVQIVDAGGNPTAGADLVVAQTNPWDEMTFDISRTTVTAETRPLKARYTDELAHDFRAVHGGDVDKELGNMLAQEITAEINREVVNKVNSVAKKGCDKAIFTGLTTDGVFDIAADTDARWQFEAYKGLYFQIEREANLIGRHTGRGRGNVLIVSPDVASALECSQKLDTAALDGSIVGGWTGVTYAGVLNNKYKVFIDPYAAADYVTVGFKGSTIYEAGYFYCPYVALQQMRTKGEESFENIMGFKTRYGMVANPYTQDAANGNQYYRRFTVANLAVTH